MKITLVRGRAIDSAVYKVAEALSRNGYNVKLLVWDRQGTLKDGSGDGYTICRFNLKAPYDRLTGLFYLPIWWVYEFFFLLKDKCDVIHACDLDTLIPAIPVKLIKRVKLCYTIYDFYANNLPDGRFALLRKFIRSLVAAIEKFGIRFTEALFLVDESRYEEVKGARINKLVYVYNSPPDYLKAKPERRLETTMTEVIIFYAGVLTKPRGLEYMIKAIEDLDGVRLVIAGTGPDKDLVETSAQQCKIIQYIGQIPYGEVIKRSLGADIIFALYDPKIPNNKHASPNKLFEAMMCAKPIIVSDDTSMSNIIREESCGIVVPYGDVDAIREAILKLKNNVMLRQELGDNGRKAYEERYAWEIMKGRLINAYDKMVKSV